MRTSFAKTSFLLGMLSAVFAGSVRSTNNPPIPQRRTTWLAVAAVVIGLTMGLCVFAVWNWQAMPVNHRDFSGFLAISCGFGLFAGIVTGTAVLLLGRRGCA